MTTTEIKEELHKAIETIPEESLKDVLGLVNKIQQNQFVDDQTIDKHLDAIISENDELLQKLAQ
jgi:Asp-tRNA(Asn)/Glu-tRNA(Gln) amidotransferase B subunit